MHYHLGFPTFQLADLTIPHPQEPKTYAGPIETVNEVWLSTPHQPLGIVFQKSFIDSPRKANTVKHFYIDAGIQIWSYIVLFFTFIANFKIHIEYFRSLCNMKVPAIL